MSVERILVVDEEPMVRLLVTSTLRKAGYAVDMVESGQEALQLLRVHKHDLVVADMFLPSYAGIDLLERVTSLYQGTGFILLSAAHDAAAAIEAMRKGATDVLLKPFEAQALLTSVHRSLEHGAERRQNSTYREGLEQLVEARTRMLRQAVNELERSYDITLEALGDALDLKDSETEGHSRRVTAYTIALARVMGLPQSEIKVIARGAFLHDIGKMAIPDAILLKPGRLDGPEQSIMREHCLSGYLIVRKIPFLKDASEIVYSHQEHFDGSGYPRQLKGYDIPLGSRIFSVADTLDAITSDRPYRKATSFLNARKEIMRCAGSQFDPQVVDAFLGMPPEIWEDLRAEIVRRGRSQTEPLAATG
jgi:putative nucleotidyltransferase with HDIG domain